MLTIEAGYAYDTEYRKLGRFVNFFDNLCDWDTMDDIASERLSVTVSDEHITIGGQITITVSAFSHSYRPRGGITITITGCNIETYKIERPGKITLPVLRPGEYTIVASGAGIMSSEPVGFMTHFPDTDMILNNKAVSDGFEAQWLRTLKAATESECCEFGAIVYANTTGGSLVYDVELVDGIPMPYLYGGVTFMNPVKDLHTNYMTKGGRWVVMIYHTHPPFFNHKSEEVIMRLCGPSKPDLESIYVSLGIPHIVRDFLGSPNRRGAMMHRSNTKPEDPENSLQNYSFGRYRRPHNSDIG